MSINYNMAKLVDRRDNGSPTRAEIPRIRHEPLLSVDPIAGQSLNPANMKALDIASKVGSGGMADVYAAIERETGKKFAVKFMKPELCTETNYQRFFEEARTQATISHPNVVRLYGIGRFEMRHFMIMDFIEGRNLNAILEQEGHFSWERTRNLMLQLCNP